MQLTFNEEDHTYWMGLNRVPSVTEILHAVGLLPDYTFVDEWYSERGTAVHAAIALDIKGELDEESVDDEVRPYLENARHAMEVILPSVRPGTFYIERMSHEVSLGYAGTPDLQIVDWSGEHPSVTTIEWKCGPVEKAHHLQVAAYSRLLGPTKADRGYIVSLGGNLPKIHCMAHREMYEAKKNWEIALAMYRLREKFGTLPKPPQPQEVE